MNSSQQHQLPSKQLRSQLRGVVSHRVMQITRQSKQQQQQPRTDPDKSGVKLQRLGSFNLTQTITTPTQTPTTTITPPKKLADKASLVEHCRAVYREAVDKDLPVVQTAKSIIDAISDYSRENSLNIAATVELILKENLFKTEQQLKLFYNNEPTDKMKTEAELKIILQLENYILSNTPTTATSTQSLKVDDDFIWEIANSIKWLSRTFKQRFKIEKFLFGEIYNAYHTGATNEMVKAIMEELGYDKDDENKSDNDSEADGDEDKENDAAKKAKSPVTSPIAALLALDTQESVDGGEFNTPVKKPPAFELYATKETSSLSTTITSRVSCLFEDTCSQSANDIEPSASNFYDELSQTGASFCYNEDTCDVLNEFKSRKLHSRSNSHSLNSVTINRSVVVQRKRTQLKIRSPHKSPSKRLMVPHDIQRKSPRLRDKQLLLGDNDRKRPRSSCLVTDTPDHKQTSLLTIKQEKRRKRFSVIDQANNSPIIPETPAKEVDDDGHKSEDTAPKIISISSRYRDLMFSAQSRSYSLSPKKSLALRK